MATDRNDRENRPQRYDRDERDVGDRAGDEVRSWFGDDDAQRCRRMDELERDRYGDRDRYVDYGEMFRTGAGWAGGRAGGGRYGGDFGGRYGTEVGNRYGGEVRGRYRSGYGLDDDRFDDPYERRYASDRWGASDWQEQDARSRGRHAGRGPADYRRSAERILEDANEAITWHGEVDASQIKVKVEGDEVILEGTVDSRRAKRAAEDAVEDVRGVRDVHNRLRVQAQGEGGAVTTGSGTT
ncbi:MAG TPA: BON domain-containing protein [Trueperaceae bacterium]|nr:BON domain-containing protein [Trueperaceae bacterium]